MPCWHTWETRRLRAGNAQVNSGVAAYVAVLSGNVPGTVRA
jgi:hypothetical protein